LNQRYSPTSIAAIEKIASGYSTLDALADVFLGDIGELPAFLVGDAVDQHRWLRAAVAR